MITMLRTILLIVVGWYLVKWLVRWISSGSGGSDGGRASEKEDYEDLTDQKIDDADYEDL